MICGVCLRGHKLWGLPGSGQPKPETPDSEPWITDPQPYNPMPGVLNLNLEAAIAELRVNVLHLSPKTLVSQGIVLRNNHSSGLGAWVGVPLHFSRTTFF